MLIIVNNFFFSYKKENVLIETLEKLVYFMVFRRFSERVRLGGY